MVLIVPWKQDVTLSCQSVGKPEPSVIWKQWGQMVKSSARISMLPDGSLQITELHREDSGNYTCFVENRHGSDQITHRLTVQGILALTSNEFSFTLASLSFVSNFTKGWSRAKSFNIFYSSELINWISVKKIKMNFCLEGRPLEALFSSLPSFRKSSFI